MMYTYFFFLLLMLGLQCAIVGYCAAHGSTIETMAASTIHQAWGKQCECVEGKHCVPSEFECLDQKKLPPTVKISCMPCEDYLKETVCHDTLDTADACAAKVEGMISNNVELLLQLFVSLIVLEALCMLCAIRIAKWSWAAHLADQDEESLLADAYMANRLMFRV